MTVLHLCGKRAIALALLVAAALVLAAPGAATADDLPDLPDVPSCSDPGAECVDGMPVVPSLDPEWSRSFEPPPLPRLRNFAACRPVSLVFYTATDWFRVAQKMRGNPSACGDYYVFVPALANGDKTQMRPNEAARIRGLGAQMHAAAEINWNAWSTWVANGNGTFYDAGVEARKRMLAVGYDFAAGDTWALNELPSSARTNTGTVRADARELVRGLYTGDGTGTTVPGIVWLVGLGQTLADPTSLKANLKAWYEDAAFWTDMSRYVRFWGQEAYGDARKWAVPGSDLATRRDRLVEYLEYADVLAQVAPASGAAAKAFFQAGDAPLATGTWAWNGTYGFTAIPSVQVQAYVAAQIYAFRHYQGKAAWRDADSFGFAWQPNNSLGVPAADFTAQSAAILDRMAASIHGSETGSDEDPGIGACGPEGAWCAADIDGATFNTAWQAFGTWTQPVATDSAATLAEDASAAVPLIASDVDGDTLTYTLLSQPAHGSLSGEGAARTYTPAADYNGADSFTFRVSDGAMSSRIATVRLTVTPVNDAPTVELAPAGPVDEGASVTLTAHAADVDGDPVSLAWSTDRGTLAGTGDSATFTAGDGPGAAHVTVTGDDGTGGTATTALDVEVRNVAPVVDAGPDAEAVWGLAIDLSGRATDPSAADTAAGLVATWDVGDGSPAAGGPTASHAYAVPGIYTAALSVADKDGGRGEDAATVRVLARPDGLAYAGPSSIDVADAVLAFRLDDTSGAPSPRLGGHTLTLELGAAACTAVTDAGGVARCAVDASALPLGAATVTARFAGDDLYAAAATSAPVTLIAHLAVTANDLTRPFGRPNAALTYSIAGFVPGDGPAVVSGAAACSTTAQPASPGGRYPIVCSLGTLAAPNYVFDFAPGALTVTYTRVINARVDGSLRVAAGQSVRLGPGADVRGPVTVEPGGAIDVDAGAIGGRIRADGAAAIRVCGATVAGPLEAIGSSGPVLVGDPAARCAGSTFAGPVTLQGNKGGVQISGAVVGGPLVVTGNAGGAVVTGNTVFGRLAVTGNTGSTIDRPNTVYGPSTLQ